MQMVHKGENPGQTSIIFMPMDMKSRDESCILSTTHFVSEQAKCNNTSPVLTFDQPLYWKELKSKKLWMMMQALLKNSVVAQWTPHCHEFPWIYWPSHDFFWTSDYVRNGLC